MQHVMFGTLGLVYMSVALLVATYLTGLIAVKILKLPRTMISTYVIGFSVLPAIIAYLSYIHFWRIPHSAELAGILLFSYGIYTAVRVRKMAVKLIQVVCTPNLIVVLVPLLALICIKIQYLWGGEFSHGDEINRTAFVSSFANNFLKPAHPVLLGEPIVYPYYLFETGAFLYAITNGITYPGTALLTVTIAAISLGFLVLFEVCNYCCKHNKNGFIYVVILITTSPITFNAFNWITRSIQENKTIGQMTGILNAGYHYFFGITLACLAVTHAQKFIEKGRKEDARLCVIELVSCFTFAGIPFIWAFCGFVLYGIHELLYAKKIIWLRLLGKEVPMLLFITTILVAPQWANFLPRDQSIFSVTSPHWWFIRPAIDIIIGWKALVATSTLTLLNGAGIFLGVGFVIAPLFLILRKHYSQKWHKELVPYGYMIVGTWLLLICTSTNGPDWFGRGPLFAFICVAIIIGVLVSHSKKNIQIIMCALLVLPVLLGVSQIPIPSYQIHNTVRLMHNQIPLHVIYTEKMYSPYSVYAIRAGRGVYASPPEFMKAYLVGEKARMILNMPNSAQPCLSTWYNAPLPIQKGVTFDGEFFKEYSC